MHHNNDRAKGDVRVGDVFSNENDLGRLLFVHGIPGGGSFLEVFLKNL